jgi:hypothetical protein
MALIFAPMKFLRSTVVGVEVRVSVCVNLPLLLRPEWMRQRHFGLERPAIGTQVENLVGAV